jgi:glycogen synthase
MQNQDSNIHILFCSRLVKEKGVDILLNVISHTLSNPKYNTIIWHIASDGEYEEQIKEIALSSNKHVLYHGKMSQRELADLMRTFNYLYMPSRFLETF